MDGRPYHVRSDVLTLARVADILERPVSWIFSFLLACYVLVRIVLRVRGQLRWLGIRDTLPTPPAEVAGPPRPLSPALGQLFVDARRLRIELTEARRVLMTVAVTDPDAPLGHVRDARYRRALMESWTKINHWLRGLERLDELELASLTDHHLGTGPIEQLAQSLREPWRAVARARALDPFEIEQLHAVLRTLEQLDDQLAALERGLERMGEDPYRDRFPAFAGA